MDYEDIDTMLSKTSGLTGAGQSPLGALTLRERFRRTMFYQDVALLPNFEFGYWERTLEMWKKQGLPDTVDGEATAYEYFGIENWAMVNVNPNPLAPFEHTVIEENDDYITYRDSMGCTARINKKGDKSIPHFIDYPVKDRKSWEPFRKALDPESPERWEGFEESLKNLASVDAPIGVYAGSMAGIPRNLIGFERIATMVYEDPDLLKDIMDAFGACTVAVLEKALSRIQVDFAMGWEDICFNQGPIISPDFFRATAGPWYRRIADLLVTHGCCVYTTDTDGNIMPIIEVFLDNGLNTMFPVEVHGGSDPCAIRDKYGKYARLWGGFDKMKLLHGKKAINAELERLRPYVEQGGFLPGVDHRVQADVPLKNYLYYLDRKREKFNVGGVPKY